MITAGDVLERAERLVLTRQPVTRRLDPLEQAVIEALVDEVNAEIERQIGAVLERVEVLVSANRPEVVRDIHGLPL